MSTTRDLGLLALIFAAALLGPALTLATRGALPAVVGELVAGVILGKTALGIVNPANGEFALLYDLGFLTLMFTVGMRVPLHDERIRGAIGKGAVAVLAVVGGGGGGCGDGECVAMCRALRHDVGLGNGFGGGRRLPQLSST